MKGKASGAFGVIVDGAASTDVRHGRTNDFFLVPSFVQPGSVCALGAAPRGWQAVTTPYVASALVDAMIDTGARYPCSRGQFINWAKQEGLL